MATMAYKNSNQHIYFLEDRIEIPTPDKTLVYIPSATGRLFHVDQSFVRLIKGPYGSGKTTQCLFEIVIKTCAMPYWSHGRRRARWAVVRNTSGELQTTTLKSWLSWFQYLGDIKKREKPVLTYEHVFNDGKGMVELELIFLALDRPDDIRKMKSMELCGIYVNEMSEVPQDVLVHGKGRVNHRYPSIQFCPEPYWTGIIADTNPPHEDHWIRKTFEIDNLPNYRLFNQPPGLLEDENGNWLANPNCDNACNIAADYYLMMAEGQTREYVKVFCLGQYGSVGFGRLVYPEFNSDIHVVNHIEAIQGEELILGWDFGGTPACVVAQRAPNGQLRLLKEYVTTGITGIKTFAEMVVIPCLTRDFPYCQVGRSVADPSGVTKDAILAEFSCISELCNLGINTVPAYTNQLEPRLGAVKFFLNTMVDGKPAMIVSKTGCPTIVNGFLKDYVFKRLAVKGEEKFQDKPDKNMSSHPHDGVQYICLLIAPESLTSKKKTESMQSFYNPSFNWQT